MSDAEAEKEAREEAERRWPTPDPHTGADLQPVDAARRQGFVAGAEWQASRAPQPTEGDRGVPGFAEREKMAARAWEFFARDDEVMSHDFRGGYHQGIIDGLRRAPAEPAVTDGMDHYTNPDDPFWQSRPEPVPSRECATPAVTDEMVERATHAAYMAGLGSYLNMFALEPRIRAALEAALGGDDE